MTRLILVTMLFLTALAVFVPQPAQAFELVPCGRSDQQPRTPGWKPGLYYDVEDYPDATCTLRHLFVAIVRVINYLVSMAALVAIYQIIGAGFWLATSLGNPEAVQKNKEALQNAVVGFAIVLLSFVFVNLLLNGLFGKPGATRPWWDINCLFLITRDSTACRI